VRHNLANYNSGFGFHLYGTSDSLFEDNFADFCCRWERRGAVGDRKGHMGADATGFLIVRGASRNIFRRNFARLGGDGFFLAGLTSQLEPMPCNDNLFEENDASWSPNIAFEATFSRGNIYRNNYADNCNYGFWLGFSRENILENNRIGHNRQAGIAVENGIDMQVRGNDFKENRHGILLWSKRIPEFDLPVPDNDTSRDWLIEHNTFTRNRKAIRIAADQDHGLREYSPHGTCPPPRNHTLRENQFIENVLDVELIGVEIDSPSVIPNAVRNPFDAR
jgi:parallel beta-helix repeat protein